QAGPNAGQAAPIPAVVARPPRADFAAGQPPPRIRLGLLALVVGGILLFVGLGVGLAIWCFSGPGKSPPREPLAGPAPAPVPDSGGQAPQPGTEEEAPLVTLAAADQAKVNNAVNKGISYLKKAQNDISGAWPGGRIGHIALPGLTLLECGVAKTDRAVQG